ncbi:MAG: hypothetical protein GX974_08755 [Clostridiales bacterium]|nr:hypothetical protein [Clostridiales bacterium]
MENEQIDTYSTIRIKHIIDPLWSKPAIIQHGHRLVIFMELPTDNIEQFDILLESDHCHYSLKVEHIIKDTNTPIAMDNAKNKDQSSIYRIECKISPNIMPDLYSLKAAWENGSDFMPNAVRVVDGFSNNFTFIHITDPHVCSALEDESEEYLKRAVKRINEVNPEFVLLTGDIASRYDEDKQPLDAQIIEHDYKLVQQILLELKVPLFITAGNHDLAFDFIRDFYREYIARPVKGKSLDYAFSFGDHKFITFEGFCHYDYETLAMVDKSLTLDQLKWLQSELNSAQNALSRILFYHYDYKEQLPPLFDRYNINLALRGHSGPTEEFIIGNTPTTLMVDKGVRGDRHICIIDVSTDPNTGKTEFTRALSRLI